MRALIAVTHLLGTGHLARACALADALAEAGWRAVVASGGRPAPHLAPRRAALVQLPPLASDGVDFATLLDLEDRPATETVFAERRARLSELLDELNPTALITELFPFGRRNLADEFEALVFSARARTPRPKIYCSIRDVLAPPSTEKKAARTAERLTRLYDGVLVHADPAITRLEDSWPVTDAIRPLLNYTGFVAPPPPAAAAEGDGRDEILVTAGGGPVGGALFAAAAQAARSGLVGERRWRLLVGGSDRAERISALSADGADARLTVEAVRPDFREMLGRCALSISQAGYNTVLDLASIGARAVLAPFEEGGETEQAQRAAAFAQRYGWGVVREAELSTESLAAAAEAALRAPRPNAPRPDLSGAAATARLLTAATT